MHRRHAVIVLTILVATLSAGQSATDTKAADIRKVLDAQVAAWNRGDLETFMAGYWRSPELEFYSGNAITKGWDATLARYKQRYQSGGNEMGYLEFSDLQVHTNSSSVAWVSGHWHLKMKDGSERGGLFTLIFHKMPEGWKIVHDHTS